MSATCLPAGAQVLDSVAPGMARLAPLPDMTPAEMAALVADFLRENTSGHTLYILDDIQIISESPAVEYWMQVLLERLPSNCHLILIGRVLPNLPLTELIARGEVLALARAASLHGSELAQVAGQWRRSLAKPKTGHAPGRVAGEVSALRHRPRRPRAKAQPFDCWPRPY